MPFDALDARILRLLLDRPRTSVREYARILGVARGTLQARLERLERDGVIVMAGPRVSPAALGHPVLAFVRIEVARGHLDDVGDALAIRATGPACAGRAPCTQRPLTPTLTRQSPEVRKQCPRNVPGLPERESAPRSRRP